MKMNGKQEVLAHIARRSLLLVSLLAMALTCAVAGQAQSSATTALTQDAKPALATAAPVQTLAVDAKPATSTSNAPGATKAGPPAKGAQEGIKVHGHWTIEVRNPDGTVDKHLDFENGFCTVSNTRLSFGSGDVTLTALLFGVVVPGPWQITLGSPVIPTFPAGGTPGPACGSLANTSNSFQINQSNATLLNSSCQISSLCFPVLTPPALTASNNGLILAGQFTVPLGTSNTTITAVETSLGVCLISTNATPSTCIGQTTGMFPFSGTYLTGIGSVPAAPTVTAGQTVAVSVQYSFN